MAKGHHVRAIRLNRYREIHQKPKAWVAQIIDEYGSPAGFPGGGATEFYLPQLLDWKHIFCWSTPIAILQGRGKVHISDGRGRSARIHLRF
jgi:hypothetical protein